MLFAHTGVLYHTPFCFAIGIFVFYNLFTILFSLPFPAYQTARQLGGGELDQDRVLPDALDAAPGDAVALGLGEAEKAAVLGDDEGGDLAVLGTEGHRRGVAQLTAVAEVDDLHAGKLARGDLSHRFSSVSIW